MLVTGNETETIAQSKGKFMFRRTSLIALLITAFTAAGAFAQEAARVGVVNPARIFQDMQETKDLKQKLENDRATLEKEVQSRQNKVKDLLAARDLLKPDSAQYAEADQKFMQEAIQFDTWSKITQAQLQGQQKQQMKVLFDKIVSTTQEVAQQRQIDLVVADQRPDLPENLAQVNVEQLRAILNGRNIMYMSPKVDISGDVIAALDAKYRAGGGQPTPPPAAPTPGATAPGAGGAAAPGAGGQPAAPTR
jgi:outer membrane protein